MEKIVKSNTKERNNQMSSIIKTLKYKIYNPGGNKTALVINKGYTINEKKYINDFLLNKNKELEQVGFIKENEYLLEMAGGEFCVNAARSAVWEYLNGRPGKINIKVSGSSESIEGGIENKDFVYVKVPINKKKVNLIEFRNGYEIVNLEGISFAVFSRVESLKYIGLSEKQIKNICKKILIKLNLNNDANGAIIQKDDSIYPVIWVKNIDTLYLETACGSGSLALAIARNMVDNKKEYLLLQPSGKYLKIELKIEADVLKFAKISGKMEE